MRNVRYWHEYCFWVFIFIALFLPRLALAIEISPVRQTLVIDPGETGIAAISVANDTASAIAIVGEAGGFGLDPEGRPLFDRPDPAAAWVSVPQTKFTLDPGEEAKISFVITVPQEAEPGEHFLALYARTLGSEGQIGLATRIGSLLFLHVGGTVTESLSFRSFVTPSWWHVQPPIFVDIALENTGTIHLVPEGQVTVSNWRGKIVERHSLNDRQRKVFPNTFWRATYEVGQNFGWLDAGPVTVEATVFFGQSFQKLNTNTRVWFIPWQGVAVGALAVIALWMLGIFLLRRWRYRHGL